MKWPNWQKKTERLLILELKLKRENEEESSNGLHRYIFKFPSNRKEANFQFLPNRKQVNFQFRLIGNKQNFNFRLHPPTPYKRSGDKLDRRPIFEPNWTGESTFLAIYLKKGVFSPFLKQNWTGDVFLSPDLLYEGV